MLKIDNMVIHVIDGAIGKPRLLEKEFQPYQFTLRDILVNGQTDGIENAIHRDCPHNDEGWYTLLAYINPKWHVDWCCETMFHNHERTDVIYCVLLGPDRLVFFDARHHQWDGPTTRNTQNLRVSVAVNLNRSPESKVPL